MQSQVKSGIHITKRKIIKYLYTTANMWKQPVSINRQMDKADMVFIYDGILLSHKKEQNIAICSNVDRLGGYCAM